MSHKNSTSFVNEIRDGSKTIFATSACPVVPLQTFMRSSLKTPTITRRNLYHLVVEIQLQHTKTTSTKNNGIQIFSLFIILGFTLGSFAFTAAKRQLNTKNKKNIFLKTFTKST